MDKDTHLEKVERVSENKFIAHHDDGSKFFGEVKEEKSIKPFFDVQKKRGAPSTKKYFNGVSFDKEGNIIR